MARMILGTGPQQQSGHDARQSLDARGRFGGRSQTATDARAEAEVARSLRRTRSKEFMQLIGVLDAGGPTCNQREVANMIAALHDELPLIELPAGRRLIGLVAVCHLGSPYEVHTLGLAEEIVRHYQRGEPLPGGMEKARSLALHGGYAYIEVYEDCCIAILPSGSTAVIPG